MIDLIKEEDSSVNLSNTIWKPSVYSIKRMGHNVEVNYYIKHSEAAAATHRYTIGSIPEELRPDNALSFSGWCCDNNGNRYTASVDIYSNGTISMVGGTGFIEFGFHIMYMI